MFPQNHRHNPSGNKIPRFRQAGWRNQVDFWSLEEVPYTNFDSDVEPGSEARIEITFFLDVRLGETLLKSELSEIETQIINHVSQCETSIRERLSENSIVTPFNFSKEIRSSCEQYLVYFAQSLEDVGISATTDLKHDSEDANQVLFSVTPTGGKEALSKVRQALELYLDLGQVPTSPNFSGSIEVQRMQSQMLHFQGQLALANAVIQQKEAAIALKDDLIAQIQARAIFAEAQKAAPKTNEERKIALFKGTVHLKRYDAKLVDIDLPAIYDLLSAWFADEQSTGDLAVYAKQKGVKLPGNAAPALPPASDD